MGKSINEKKFKEELKKMPTNVDFEKLSDYEDEDNTTGTQELSCTAGACELVDITSTVAA